MVGQDRAGHQHSQAIQLFSNNYFMCDCHCVCLLRRRCLISYYDYMIEAFSGHLH